MAFHDILFNPEISYGAVGGSQFSTTVLVTKSGSEQRNQNWSKSGGVWDVAHNLKSQTELDDLNAFFRARYAKTFSFRFLDWTDYDITSETIGTKSGSGAEAFQITKTYSSGGYTFIRDILKPVNVLNTYHTLGISTPGYTTMSVTVGVSPLTETTDYTVDYSTGIVTVTATDTGSVVVSCSFHVHARFDTDQMNASIDDFNKHNWNQIPVIELKEAN